MIKDRIILSNLTINLLNKILKVIQNLTLILHQLYNIFNGKLYIPLFLTYYVIKQLC